jgi:hypothetical protein
MFTKAFKSMKVLLQIVFAFPIIIFFSLGFMILVAIYKDPNLDTAPFTTVGFAILGALTSLSLAFLKTIDENKKITSYYEVRKGAVNFFVSALFFLSASALKFMFQYLLTQAISIKISLIDFLILSQIIAAFIFFYRGYLSVFSQLLPQVDDTEFFEEVKRRVELNKAPPQK